MMKTIYILVLSLVFATACQSSKQLTEAQRKTLTSWGTATPFRIESNWAKPMPTSAYTQVANSGILGPGNNASQINLMGNANYFTMKGDTITGYLPYFGERYTGGGYNNTTAFEFEGIPKEKEMTFNEQKQRMEMRFVIKQKNDNEILNMLLLIFPNNTTRLDVNSSERAFITYDGTIQALEEQ